LEVGGRGGDISQFGKSMRLLEPVVAWAKTFVRNSAARTSMPDRDVSHPEHAAGDLTVPLGGRTRLSFGTAARRGGSEATGGLGR
jgi:hypothetical protein